MVGCSESGEAELSSEALGELVLSELVALDTLAAARFASVFRDFKTAADYDAYLATLAQVATTRPFLPGDLDRITQLVNKSNQWNVTTPRLSRSQVEAMAVADDRLCRTVRLRDRFGDNGLISVFAAQRVGHALEIDLWLMSCRVLKRGVERHLFNHVAEAARALGLRESLILRKIVLPQAMRLIVPPTGNQFISMLKDSSLVSVVTVTDSVSAPTSSRALTRTMPPGVTGMPVCTYSLNPWSEARSV